MRDHTHTRSLVRSLVTWAVIVLGYLISNQHGITCNWLCKSLVSLRPSYSSSFFHFLLKLKFYFSPFLAALDGNYGGKRTKCALLIWCLCVCVCVCVCMSSTNKFVRCLHCIAVRWPSKLFARPPFVRPLLPEPRKIRSVRVHSFFWSPQHVRISAICINCFCFIISFFVWKNAIPFESNADNCAFLRFHWR